jgi:CoA:oxalate CoA-transferase
VTRPGPLSGIRILEATHVLAGPYCGMLLADLGAEVIKIEMPDKGDIGREFSPHFIGRHNAYFASLNRNKKSVTLDLTSEQGQRDLGRLAATAQGLITNMRPAAIRKLGLTYEALRKHNERIACLALTGYGLDGPYSDKPAYDYVIQALAGVMALTGDPDGPPTKAGYSAVDNSAGIMGALGLVAKIHEGKGGQVDVSLYDAMLSQLNYLAGAYLNAGEMPTRQRSGAHPYIVPAQIFPARDGHLALFITHDAFWRRFAEEVGRPDWLTDPHFATMAARSKNRAQVLPQIEAVLRQESAQGWVERLGPLGIVVAAVQTLDVALASDLTRARRMVVTIQTEDGPIQVLGNPIKCDGDEEAFGAPPLLGEHTDSLLAPETASR